MNPTPHVQRIRTLVSDLEHAHIKLAILVKSGPRDEPRVLSHICSEVCIERINVSLELSRLLATTPNELRAAAASPILRTIAQRSANALLLYNLEVLFDRTLLIDPLELIKRLAHSRVVLAVWPGRLRGDHLTYANVHHPEHRDYSSKGIVVLEI